MKNIIYIILAGCLWGIISIFITLLKEMGFDSLQCVAIRAFCSAAMLFLYILFTDRSKFRIAAKDIKYFLGTGILSIMFFNFCYFEAIEMVGGAAVPALLLYTAPIFVMLLSAVIFKEKITRRKMTSLVLTFIGLGFVTGAFTGGETISALALLLGLGSGLGYALYSIFGKMVVNKYDAVSITFYTFLVAAVSVVPLSGVMDKVNGLFSVKGALAAFGLAFFSTVLPFLLYTKGLQGVEAGKASILATVEPFVAVVTGVLFFHEALTVPKGIGMLMVLSAIIYLNMDKVVTENCTMDCHYTEFDK